MNGSARVNGQPVQVESSKVTHVDAAHKEILVSPPLLFHSWKKNQTISALMVKAYAETAVPLRNQALNRLLGIENDIARATSQLIVAEGDGVVEKADGKSVIVKYADKTSKEYIVEHFEQTNS